MPDTQTAASVVEIPLNKGKIALMLIGSVAFVAAGIWFIVKPETFKDVPFFFGGMFTVIIGIASVALFGLLAVLIFKKIFDNKPGMIIDEKGIWDNSSAFSSQQISWSDVTAFDILVIKNQKMIKIMVSNPADYVANYKSALKRKLAGISYNTYGTPINISTNTLKCDFYELNSLLRSKWEEHKG